VTSQALCDTTDMVVVHRVFRREFGLLPRMVRATASGDTVRAAQVATHARELLVALHHHHHGEDDLLWPKLAQRVDLERPLVERMEQQHESVAALVDRATGLLPAWEISARNGEELSVVLQELAGQLNAHLAEEETEVLPVVRQKITEEEWAELGKRGMASIPPKRRLVFLGHILEEASPDERATFMHHVPPPARLAYRMFGTKQHRAEVKRLRGPLG
jgi:hemerythrin-like domain-containing protein